MFKVFEGPLEPLVYLIQSQLSVGRLYYRLYGWKRTITTNYSTNMLKKTSTPINLKNDIPKKY